MFACGKIGSEEVFEEFGFQRFCHSERSEDKYNPSLCSGGQIQSADRTNMVIVVVVVSIPVPIILVEFADHEIRACCSRYTHHTIVADTMTVPYQMSWILRLRLRMTNGGTTTSIY